MNANITTSTIYMNKTEAKAAGKVNSPEFIELNALRAAYPDFRIEVKTTKSKDSMKGLTAEYMEKFIEARIEKNEDEVDMTNLQTFYILRGRDEEGNKVALAPVVSYGELKQWFLAQYPEVEEMTKTVDDILAKAKAKRAAAKEKEKMEAAKAARAATMEILAKAKAKRAAALAQ